VDHFPGSGATAPVGSVVDTIMEWLMVLAFGAAGGAGAYVASRVRTSRTDRREKAEELEQVRKIADEDVTVFGEQLQRLGGLVDGHELDEATRADYQIALDAYEHAKFAAPRLRAVDEISALVDTLAGGRYAILCVRAGLAGEPAPERTLPCFFNPQHGPSARKVMWTSARTGTRTVPACGRCATQLAAREKPEVRTVRVGGRTVPYWEAGATFHPYSRGYFSADAAVGASMGWVLVVAETGSSFGYGGSGFEGGYGGFDGGGGDGGGGT
jgi:hypothetical protein